MGRIFYFSIVISPTFGKLNKRSVINRIYEKIIITFISLIIGILSRAQTVNEHYYFKNLSSQNGLSQNTVSAILQDSKGFMWFGTKDGLDRYDGVSFRHFKYDRNNPRSLGNNFVTSLYEDIEGNIWVGTDVGVYIYYPEKDTFRHFVEQSDKTQGWNEPLL